jgi:hypothetical protein
LKPKSKEAKLLIKYALAGGRKKIIVAAPKKKAGSDGKGLAVKKPKKERKKKDKADKTAVPAV